MKRLSFYIIFYLLFILTNPTFSKSTTFHVGEVYSGTVKFSFVNYDLPSGEWELFDKYYLSFDELPTIRLECLGFVQTEKNTIKGAYEICDLRLGGLASNQIGSFFVSEYKTGRYDSCILRPEYYYTNLFTKGGSSNCFITRHIDVNKEVYFPDDPNEHASIAKVEKFLKLNNLILPKTMLHARSGIFVPSIKDKGIFVSYSINPELFGAPKVINGVEEKSEYHRNNIEDFPEQKNFLRNWTIEQTSNHKKFEKLLKIRSYHKLDFSDLN